MRSFPRISGICADCTARYAAVTRWRTGTCDHDSSACFTPLTRADTFVPADSLDRSPRVGVVELAQLFVQGRALYRSLTSGPSWSPSYDQSSYAYGAVALPWGGTTLQRQGGHVDSDVLEESGQDTYAVAIRPRAAVPVWVRRRQLNHDDFVGYFEQVDSAIRGFVTTAPYVGVFRDEVSGTVDVDPVAIVTSRREADALGVYCGATGGAYNYADGLGYWAPVL